MKIKSLVTGFILLIVLRSCTGNAASNTPSETSLNAEQTFEPHNFVVLLDLSDRLIFTKDQHIRDSSVISMAFAAFEKKVSRNLTIKSNDRFLLRIIPQEGGEVNIQDFENALSLDLSLYNASEKSNRFNLFKSRFSQKLNQLYQQADRGFQTKDYPGAKTWMYFKDQLNDDLHAGMKNTVIVLTDGYLDYEDPYYMDNKNGICITTSPIISKLNGKDWKSVLQQESFGIEPVNITTDAHFLICGIQSKNPLNLLEIEKLSSIWEKWLKASGVKQELKSINNSSSDKMKSLLSNYL